MKNIYKNCIFCLVIDKIFIINIFYKKFMKVIHLEDRNKKLRFCEQKT